MALLRAVFVAMLTTMSMIMAGIDGGQDLLVALRAGDEQKFHLLCAVPKRHERGEFNKYGQDSSAVDIAKETELLGRRLSTHCMALMSQ